MACGVCGEIGHNRRTCASTKSGTLKVNPSGDILESRNNCHSSSVNKKPTNSKSTPTFTTKSSNNSNAGSKTSIRSYSTNAASSDSKSIEDLNNAILESREINLGVIDSFDALKHVLRKAKENYIESKQKPSTNLSYSYKKSTEEANSKPLSLPPKKDSPIQVNHEKRKSKKAVPLGKSWLTEKALERLDKGPSEKEVEGHIYIYKLTNPKTSKDFDWYKIGCSKDLPQRRVKQQESTNHEDYTIVRSFSTPWKYVTDTMIKHQLKEFHDPKEKGDGRPEWYRGNVNHFIGTIEKTIREVNGEARNY